MIMADFTESKTYSNLAYAFAGESQARNKYTYFASVARKEGYEQIAAIFLALAVLLSGCQAGGGGYGIFATAAPGRQSNSYSPTPAPDMLLIDRLIPESRNPHEVRKVEEMSHPDYKKRAFRSGILFALAIAIHNFPEGMAVFMSGMISGKTGIFTALAVAIHNIPEGITVSVPIYHATGSRKKAFLWSFASGLSEPLGALAAYFLFLPFLTETLLMLIYAGVAGIMVFLTFDELLPLADILIPSEEFSLAKTGAETAEDAARILFDTYHPELVVITRGVRGGVLYDGNELRTYDAFRVNAVDSNGAGDVFHGAFAVATVKGLRPYEACIFSGAVSALKCTKVGARDGVPTLSQTIEFLKEHGYELQEIME